MRNILTRSSLFFIVLVMVASCKHGDDSLAGKKAELETLKADQQKTAEQLECALCKFDITWRGL